MRMSDRYRVLIIGCGELGSRHLQAVARLTEVEEIQVVDPRPEALHLGRERLAEVGKEKHSVSVRWLTSLEETTPESDLCIVATRAKERPFLVREAADLGVRLFLLEKWVAPSMEQMEELKEFLKTRGVLAWVNLKTRAYPFHQRAKKRLDPTEPLFFCVAGGNLGLANNGIHAADCFIFYTDADRIEGAGSSIDSILHPSKRGGGLFDLSGVVLGATATGSRFSLSYMMRSPDSAEVYSLASPRYRFFVDHFQRWAYESDRESGWQWRQVPFEGNLQVSSMTTGFVREILTSQRCLLPTLEESLISHQFLSEALRPHFNRLMERESQLCPVP